MIINQVPASQVDTRPTSKVHIEETCSALTVKNLGRYLSQFWTVLMEMNSFQGFWKTEQLFAENKEDYCKEFLRACFSNTFILWCSRLFDYMTVSSTFKSRVVFIYIFTAHFNLTFKKKKKNSFMNSPIDCWCCCC